MNTGNEDRRLVCSHVCFALALLTGCAAGGSPAVAPQVAVENWIAGNTHEIAGIDPANDNFADLRNFGVAIGDARIVGLAEQTHGDGSNALLRTRLVKYLHQKKRFDVVMFEAGIFGALRMQQLIDGGAALDDISAYELADTFAVSLEGRRTLQYIDSVRGSASPLIFTGMDANQTGRYVRRDLVPMLETYLNGTHAATVKMAGWPAYKTLLQRLATYDTATPSSADKTAFYSVQDSLESELCAAQPDAYVFPASPGLWCRIAKSMRNQSMRFWSDAGDGYRDRDMASNAAWLLEHLYKNRKVIILSHMIHLMHFDAGSGFGQRVGGASMGNYLRDLYGSQLYVTGFTSSGGSYVTNASTAQTQDIPADMPGSVEEILHKMNKPVLFVDARRAPPPPAFFSLPSKTIWYTPFPFTVLGNSFEGLFYTGTNKPFTISRSCSFKEDRVTLVCP